MIPALLKKMAAKAIEAFDRIVFNTREIIRPGRSLPRKPQKKKPFSMNYKPI